jgi:endonuclease/exonuclease/phosphatase family metal-dependent hydrolase
VPGVRPPCDGWLICGDFNSRPESDVVATLCKAGHEFAHAGHPDVRSAAVSGRASLLDYLFHTRGLPARSIDPPSVTGVKAPPSADQPSDHLALVADFEWPPTPSGPGGGYSGENPAASTTASGVGNAT